MVSVDHRNTSFGRKEIDLIPLQSSRKPGESKHGPLRDEGMDSVPIDLANGLTSEQVMERKAVYGPNDVTHTTKKRGRMMLSSRFQRVALILGLIDIILECLGGEMAIKFLGQFHNPLILLLLASAAISMLLGQIENCLSIAVVFIISEDVFNAAVLLVVTVAFIQEWRTEKSLEALNRLAPPKCRAVRDGKIVELLASDLVPGDLVELHTGDRVPADLRLLFSIDIETDESMLTGETKSCLKQAGSADDTLLMATLIRQGYGRAMVIATGPQTRFGRMYSLMKDTTERKSPLQLHLDRLGQQLSIYSLGVITVIALLGILQRQPILQIFTVAVSLAVAAIPEGLPIVATITLALGVLRLSRRNVIVRRLPAVEALGSVDVLCIDKTGTLTMNQLTVQKIFLTSSRTELEANQMILRKPTAELDVVLKALRICNNGRRGEGGGEWHGNAVDVSILKFLDFYRVRHNIDIDGFTRVEETSFTSERKFMAIKCIDNVTNDSLYIIKGAPEVVLSMASYSGGPEPTEIMYAQGLRVIALAVGKTAQTMQVIALIGMCDPPRPDISTTLLRIRHCGIKCVMITGDSKQTAMSVAKQVGWSHSDGQICSGTELELRRSQLPDISIVYRASPEHKLTLVDFLQKQGHVVAMTGDGVNDAPALRTSDIGIAMGRSGTDVARAAAQIILTDDRLGSLVDGIEEGKAIFSNIRHFLRFQLSTSLAALSLIAVSMVMGDKHPPMNAMQILLVNIIMDGPPAQSLGVEPTDPTVLTRSPRPKSAPILSRPLLTRTATSAVHIVIGTLLILRWERSFGEDTSRTFAMFVLFSIVNAIICRSNYRSIFQLGLVSNRFLLISSIISLFMLLATIYVPTLNRIFQTSPLSLGDWFKLSLLASSLLILDELIKALIVRPSLLGRGRSYDNPERNPIKPSQICTV